MPPDIPQMKKTASLIACWKKWQMIASRIILGDLNAQVRKEVIFLLTVSQYSLHQNFKC